jgi:hypothetical protein
VRKHREREASCHHLQVKELFLALKSFKLRVEVLFFFSIELPKIIAPRVKLLAATCTGLS